MDATTQHAVTDQAHTLEERKATQDAQRKALWRMSREERESAMWGGRLSEVQLLKWSRKRPDEVPKLGGEFAWIVMTPPDWAEAKDRPRGAEPVPDASVEATPHCLATGKPIPNCSCAGCHELFVAAVDILDQEAAERLQPT